MDIISETIGQIMGATFEYNIRDPTLNMVVRGEQDKQESQAVL